MVNPNTQREAYQAGFKAGARAEQERLLPYLVDTCPDHDTDDCPSGVMSCLEHWRQFLGLESEEKNDTRD